MIFLVLLVLFFLFMSAVSRSMSRRRRLIEEEQRDAMQRAPDSSGNGADQFSAPFGPSPFDLLFGGGMFGGGARSYELDPQTGRWVEVTDERSAPAQEPSPAASRAEEPPASPAEARRRKRAERLAQRPQQPQNPLAGLLGGGMMGGGMGGGGGDFEVQPPDELVDFAEVGGMDALKREVRDTVGLMLEHPEDAERYGIEWNGILLHGPPGVGKTFFAEAIAGEYGLDFIHVSTGDLVSSLVGGSAQNIGKAFKAAEQHLPCLLFFDEFDSIAQRRDNTPDQESRRTVNQLLTSLEGSRGVRGLLVMAATNSIEHLDPAVIRAGRFDRHIRVDLPDAEARRAVFEAELKERPVARDIDLGELVRRTEGMTPAAIEKIVDMAALDVFRQASETGEQLELRTGDLMSAIDRYGGQDRPTVENWTWESLILPANIKAQLKQLQAVIEDPESARRFGVEPPTGLLLAGPPGTGKTTIAKVLAAQARCSFYPIAGADVTSKWVGESERNIRQLFDRARENRPSIIFIDEIDAIAGRRGELQAHDSQVNQLLAEIDGVTGQRGVFIVGATNRPDQLDPALLRGGRLSRTVVLGLPDEQGRFAMLKLHTARMPTLGVRLEELARETDGMSPADLKALCQEAALAAMARTSGDAEPGVAVTHEDFEEGLQRLRSGSLAESAAF